MSKVHSFRLSEDNSRESLVIEVLNDWHMKGFSTRFIITEALLNLNKSESEPLAIAMEELNESLTHVNLLLIGIGYGGFSLLGILQSKQND